ncbi:MAG TPA: hypothetical protein VN704_07915 [Verrucomicrobiae bacterium]|nr:hypothetical protein [Verrucomicrobiae bacterium]
MIENSIDVNHNILYTIGNVTTILIIIPLIIFAGLSIKSKNIKSFQFQIFIFILMYFIGQVIENNNNQITIFSIVMPELGSQIHVIAAIFFTIMIWIRFVHSEPRKEI